MIHILRKYKSIFFLTLLVALSFSAWYFFASRNINKVPEKAELVLNSSMISRGMENEY